MQLDTCTKNNIDVKHATAVARNISIDEVNAQLQSMGHLPLEFTDDQLKLIETDLNKSHSAENVQHAMQILRGFQNEASRHTQQSPIVSDKHLTV